MQSVQMKALYFFVTRDQPYIEDTSLLSIAMEICRDLDLLNPAVAEHSKSLFSTVCLVQLSLWKSTYLVACRMLP